MIVSLRDYQVLLREVETPPEPNDALIEAAERYRRVVS